MNSVHFEGITFMFTDFAGYTKITAFDGEDRYECDYYGDREIINHKTIYTIIRTAIHCCGDDVYFRYIYHSEGDVMMLTTGYDEHKETIILDKKEEQDKYLYDVMREYIKWTTGVYTLSENVSEDEYEDTQLEDNESSNDELADNELSYEDCEGSQPDCYLHMSSGVFLGLCVTASLIHFMTLIL